MSQIKLRTFVVYSIINAYLILKKINKSLKGGNTMFELNHFVSTIIEMFYGQK